MRNADLQCGLLRDTGDSNSHHQHTDPGLCLSATPARSASDPLEL